MTKARPKGRRRLSEKPEDSPLILTVGHSTRTIEEFIQLLQAHGVTLVADVRTIPRSRHNPQFNADSLPQSLLKAGIDYIHFARLGGLRHASPSSTNLGWRNASFRGYADYMQTLQFEEALQELIKISRRGCLAMMCAEAVPWRCHRSLIADALYVRGIRAEHIMSATKRTAHSLTPFAQVHDSQLIYPTPEPRAKIPRLFKKITN